MLLLHALLFIHYIKNLFVASPKATNIAFIIR